MIPPGGQKKKRILSHVEMQCDDEWVVVLLTGSECHDSWCRAPHTGPKTDAVDDPFMPGWWSCGQS